MTDAADQMARLRREELSQILRDRSQGDPEEMIAVVMTKRVALQLADDVDRAVSAAPGLGYGRGA
jgi:hypothetical protein